MSYKWDKSSDVFHFDKPLWSGQLVVFSHSCDLCEKKKLDRHKASLSKNKPLHVFAKAFTIPAPLQKQATYRAAIRASCSASRTAASSSSFDNGLPPCLSLAYHVRSRPFCHRPTGAIREFPAEEKKQATGYP